MVQWKRKYKTPKMCIRDRPITVNGVMDKKATVVEQVTHVIHYALISYAVRKPTSHYYRW